MIESNQERDFMTNAKVVGVLLGGACLGAAVGVGVTTTLMKSSAKKSASVGAAGSCTVDAPAANAGVLFEVDGKSFTREELPTVMQDQLFQEQSRLHDVSVNMLKEVALRVALANDKKIDHKGGKELPELLTLMTAKQVTEAEMRAFFESKKNNLPPGTTFEQVRPQLEQYMQGQQLGEQIQQEVSKFENQGRMKILVKAPVAPLVNIDVTGLPFKGTENSQVVVVEASDYLCGHCREAIEDVEKVIKEFGPKIKFVQANFALRPTGLSGVLARGAWCASQQGSEQFWKFHEKAFAVPLESANPISPNTDKAFADTAIKAAQDAGINTQQFETCLASEAAKKAVEDANTKLTSVGVSGTPTFFVNNRKVGGVGNLNAAIASELEKLSANPSKAN